MRRAGVAGANAPMGYLSVAFVLKAGPNDIGWDRDAIPTPRLEPACSTRCGRAN